METNYKTKVTNMPKYHKIEKYITAEQVNISCKGMQIEGIACNQETMMYHIHYSHINKDHTHRMQYIVKVQGLSSVIIALK